MPKPTRAAISTPADQSFLLKDGPDLAIAADGDTADAPANARTSVFVRIFFRVEGIPVAIDVYNGAAHHDGANKKFDLVAGNVKAFKTNTRAFHSVRMLSWDH